jgi:hypothetical protein
MTPSAEISTLRISNTTVTCNNGNVLINVINGTPPYEYSLDAGLNWSAPASESFYSTNTELVVIDPWVRDDTGVFFRGTQVLCSNPILTVVPYYYYGAEGYVTDPNYVNHTTPFSITASYGTTLTLSATPQYDSTFMGWYYLPTETGVPFTASSVLNYTLYSDTTIYPQFIATNVVTEEYCYYNLPTSSLTTSELETICETCDDIVTVYYSKTSYDALNGNVTAISWFSSSSLNQYVSGGYYRQQVTTSSVAYPPIFILNSGSAIMTGSCDNLPIDCL